MKFLLVIFSYHLTLILAQNYCKTPSGQVSTCIPVVKCPSAMEILRDPRPLSPASIKFLRKSQCGLEDEMPLVCCEDFNKTAIAAELAKIPKPPDVSNHPNLRLLDHRLCGPLTAAKILKGQKPGVFEHPWMALLVYHYKGKEQFGCGGTIINDRYILTAAHCVTNLPENRTLWGVRVGDHDWSTKRDCDKDEDGLEIVCVNDAYQDIFIESISFHPNYSTSSIQNDVGLIRLNKAIDFVPMTVRPICLPIERNRSTVYKTFTVAGWGTTDFSVYSTELLMADVLSVPTGDCAKAYGGDNPVWYKQICAVGENGADSSSGDSGGPLQLPDRYHDDVRYLQYGIVSYGIGNYGVYTNVQYYLDWILDVMQE